nr:hypothetical protein [uncultured Bacteroides sp.]
MSEPKEAEKKALQTIKGVEAMMYQRNQAYAFIATQGLARKFLAFIKEKQCEQISDKELKVILKIYTPKKKDTKK